MATLGQLLEEIKVGKEVVENIQTSEEVETLIDEDYNLFLRSKRINNLLKCEAEFSDKPIFKKMNAVSKLFEDYENKILEGNTVSPIYKRMKADTIFDNVKYIYESFAKDKKLARTFNTNNFKKILSTIEEGYETLILESKTKKKNFPELPNYYRNYINEDKKIIAETYLAE